MDTGVLVRFLKKVQFPEGANVTPPWVRESACWLWTAGTNNGYGTLHVQGAMMYAHRVSHELFIGPIPPKADVDHLCRVLSCVNPGHLEAVSHAENLLRAHSGRVTCCHGHPLTPDNTYRPPNRGGLACRQCSRDAQRRFQERRRLREEAARPEG